MNNITEIPKKNKVELNKVLEIQLDSVCNSYITEKGKLYIATERDTLYIIDIQSGRIMKKINLEKGDFPHQLDVCNGVVSINYEDYLIVYDTTLQKLLYKYVANKFDYVDIIKVFLSNNEVIFCRGNPESRRSSFFLNLPHVSNFLIYAIDYKNSNAIWKREGDYIELAKYDDKYLYIDYSGDSNIYNQYIPETGDFIDKYEVTPGAIKFRNRKTSCSMPVVSKENISPEFNLWLINQNSYSFEITNKGYIFSDNGNALNTYNADGILKWKIGFPKGVDIYRSYPYGRYAILDAEDKAIIVDLQSKKVIWSKIFLEDDNPYISTSNDMLVISEENGTFQAYDLSKLE